MTQNHAAPLPPCRPTQPLRRRHINQLIEHANTLATITAGTGISITRTPQGLTIALADNNPPIPPITSFLARITGAASADHAWEEILPTSSGYVVKPAGRFGTTAVNPAREANGRASVPTSTIVNMIASTDTQGTTQYTFDLASGNHGSRASMSYAGEHADAASSSTWNIESQTATRGLNITVQTGTRYDHAAATPTLYAYLRTLTFNAAGQLVEVSAESRVIIDTPEDCN